MTQPRDYAEMTIDRANPKQPANDSFSLTMSRFAAAVTIVTVRFCDEIHGMTATAVCSVSRIPPLLLVCVAKSTRTHELIERSRIFAVNLLHHEQREMAERFAGRSSHEPDRFLNVLYGHAITGAPILDDGLGYYDCEVVSAYCGGDHTIFVGQVVASGRGCVGRPLIYHEGSYCAVPYSGSNV